MRGTVDSSHTDWNTPEHYTAVQENITRLHTGGAGPYRTLSLALPAALLPIVTQQTPADTKKVIDSSAPK